MSKISPFVIFVFGLGLFFFGGFERSIHISTLRLIHPLVALMFQAVGSIVVCYAGLVKKYEKKKIFYVVTFFIILAALFIAVTQYQSYLGYLFRSR